MKHFFYKIRHLWYDIVHGVSNLTIWFSVIWKDRWWDHHFFFVILHKKLSLMEKNFLENGHHVGREKDAHEMKVCRLLLERLMKDDYSPMTVHEKKWGEANFIWKECDDNSEYYTLNIRHKKVKTEKDEIQQQKEFKRAIELEEYLKKQDIEYLFRIMKKHIRSWWD